MTFIIYYLEDIGDRLFISNTNYSRVLIVITYNLVIIISADISGGFLPVQYVAAACPPGAPALLDLLLKHSRYRPIHKMSFEDTRTGESKEVKYKQDIDNMVSMVMEFRCLSGKLHLILH